MAVKLNLGELLDLLRIDDRDAAVAVADVGELAVGVEANVVGVVEAVDRAERIELSIEDAHLAVVAAGDNDLARSRHNANARRLFESLDAAGALVRRQVDRFKRVVAKRSDVKPLALDIRAKM